MKLFIFLMACALLAGCTKSSTDSLKQANTAPASLMYGFAKKSDAHLVVQHDSSFAGDKCRIRVAIDKEPAADIDAGGVAQFGITIGSHSLEAIPLEGCQKVQMQRVNITVKAGDALIKRIDMAGINSIELSNVETLIR